MQEPTGETKTAHPSQQSGITKPTTRWIAALAICCGLYLVSSVFMFDFGSPALDKYQESLNGKMTAYGPRLRSMPVDLGPGSWTTEYVSGNEWQFHVYAPICYIWRWLNNYALPLKN